MFLYCMGVYVIVLVGGTYLESPSLYGDARYRIRRSVQSNKVFIVKSRTCGSMNRSGTFRCGLRGVREAHRVTTSMTQGRLSAQND
jgi:hypothetical protein